MKLTLIALLALLGLVPLATATDYPDIPRIDVHAHPGNDARAIKNYLSVREAMLEEHGADLAMWVNVGVRDVVIEDPQPIMDAAEGRIVVCISDFDPHRGITIPAEELQGYLDRGFVGYKLWFGPPQRVLDDGDEGFPYVNDPAHDPTFAMMEEIGMVGASVHVCDPNGPFGERTPWLADPVEYWKQVMAWQEVMQRHPNMTIVNAHGMWLICQDAQLDFLRYALSTYPNLYVDLAATFQYYNLVSRDNLKDFLTEYSHKVLYGTDVGRWQGNQTENYVQRYMNTFRILETEGEVEGSFFGQEPIQGLGLPRQALENIYFRNAMRIYPRVAEQLESLGYEID